MILGDAWNFNMSSELDVLQFGGSAAHAQQLNDLFVPGEYPLWAMQLRGLPEGAVAGSPQTVDLVFAPARHQDEAPSILLRKEYGYVGRILDVTLAADGTIDHAQDGLFLPLWSADHVILLYLEDLRVTGRLDWGGGGQPSFEALTHTGVLGTRWLLQLREAGPGWRNAVGVLEPDIDTNGNDVPDAATFTLSTRPTPLAAGAIDF